LRELEILGGNMTTLEGKPGAKTWDVFPSSFEVVNREDVTKAKLGLIPAKKIRRMKLKGVC